MRWMGAKGKKNGSRRKINRNTYSVVMMGFKPSFFLFLLIAAVAAASLLALPVLLSLLLPPFADAEPPDATAPVIIGGLVFCCVCCSVCCFRPGRGGVAAAAVGPELVVVVAPAPALSWVVLAVCWPPFMLCEDWEKRSGNRVLSVACCCVACGRKT